MNVTSPLVGFCTNDHFDQLIKASAYVIFAYIISAYIISLKCVFWSIIYAGTALPIRQIANG